MCSSVNKCIQRRRKDILHSNWGVAMSQNQLDSRLGRQGARTTAAREKGITQEVLSGLSDIGRTHLSALERGERKPTLETLYRISNALDMPMSVIVAEIERKFVKIVKIRLKQLPVYAKPVQSAVITPRLCVKRESIPFLYASYLRSRAVRPVREAAEGKAGVQRGRCTHLIRARRGLDV